MSQAEIGAAYLAVGSMAAGFVGGAIALLALIPPIYEVLQSAAPSLRGEITKKRLPIIIKCLAAVALSADLSAVTAAAHFVVNYSSPAGLVVAVILSVLALVGAVPLIILLAYNATKIVGQ